jgi:group I intron endonuclease
MRRTKTCGIYRVTNLINGKIYIGSAIEIEGRWAAHKSALNKGKHENEYLQNAWAKHSEVAFVFEIIEECAPEALYEREQFWLDNSDCHRGRGGYNISPSAGTCRGVKHTEETRKRMSAAKKGKPMKTRKFWELTAEEQEAIRIVRREYYRTEKGQEHLRRMTERAKDPEARAKNADAQRGLVRTDEQRAAMAASHRRFWAHATPEQRAERGTWRGKRRPEHSAAMKGRRRQDRRSLTDDQVRDIRAARDDGLSYTTLTEKFGLDRASIYKIVQRKTYADVI